MNFYTFQLYGSLFLVGFAVIALLLFLKTVYVVKQAEVILVERLGRFHRMLGPGLHILIPFMESPRTVLWSFVIPDEGGFLHVRISKSFNRIDMRESVYDFPKQSVISKDNVMMQISALIYYQITDPKSAVYEVYNLPEAIEKLTQTTLRNVVGSMDLDETLVSRDQINEQLRLILDEASHKWGVKVNRVELQEVNPPEDIRQAMEKQMRAERNRRAQILEAEGTKQALILEAEGVQESTILRAKGTAESQIITAQGEAQARLKMAQAEAEAIAIIKEKSGADPLNYLIALQYIKALPELTKGKNDKLVVIPYEASSLIASLAPIKKMFESVAQ